jgi:hypothetical protein
MNERQAPQIRFGLRADFTAFIFLLPAIPARDEIR